MYLATLLERLYRSKERNSKIFSLPYCFKFNPWAKIGVIVL